MRVTNNRFLGLGENTAVDPNSESGYAVRGNHFEDWESAVVYENSGEGLVVNDNTFRSLSSDPLAGIGGVDGALARENRGGPLHGATLTVPSGGQATVSGVHDVVSQPPSVRIWRAHDDPGEFELDFGLYWDGEWNVTIREDRDPGSPVEVTVTFDL